MANAANNDSDKYTNLTGKIDDMDKYVHQAYDKQIDWYWKNSSSNKKSYKRFRFWTIFLGAFVTLIASLTTSEVITTSAWASWLSPVFAILTPVLAFVLTVINTLSQNFQWGATWRDMVINASRLQKEKNRFLATKVEERDYRKELNRINNIVLEETQAFFRRVLDTEAVPTDIADIQEGEKEVAKQKDS